MKLKFFKPTTPSKRFLCLIYNNILNKKQKIKQKILKIAKHSGRNYSGQITIRHKGKFHKRLYRIINYKLKNLYGIIYNLEYDPNRNCNIASVFNRETENFFYIIAPNNLKIGNIVTSGKNVEEKTACSKKLKHLSLGAVIYNIPFNLKNIGQISRSAGTYSILINKNNMKSKLIISSGQHKILNSNIFANIGTVSNNYFFLKQLGKAGRARWSGKKPKNRGVSMNPIDHPNGGGEGKKSSKKKSPWG